MTKDADKTFFDPIKERRLKTKKPKNVQLPIGTNAEKDTALFELRMCFSRLYAGV